MIRVAARASLGHEHHQMPDPTEMSPPKPLAQPGPWNEVAAGYDEVSRELMEKFSQTGLDLLKQRGALSSASRLLDVACGPGTTSLLCAEQVATIDALDFSENMLALFAQHLSDKNLGNVTLHHGDGQNLPFSDGYFDAAVSMFGLMFFPNRLAGMRELHRVLAKGGCVLISSWAPLLRSSALSALFEAVRAIDPSRPFPAPDPTSLENPEVFATELTEAGFAAIQIHEVAHDMDVQSADEFWDKMSVGAVPLVMMRKQLGEDQFAAASQLAKARLRELLGDQCKVSSVAHLAVATKR